MENELVEKQMSYQTSKGDQISLTLQMVRNYLVRGRNEFVTDQEIVFFMHTCKARKLNPFVGECYLVKYTQNDTAAIITSRNYYEQVAMEHPRCEGWQNGVIVKDEGGKIEYRQGAIVFDGENLVGGWAETDVTGWNSPKRWEVQLNGYIKKTKDGRTTRFWSEEKQPHMIAKIALVQLLREVYGDGATSLYTPDEMPSLETVDMTPTPGGRFEEKFDDSQFMDAMGEDAWKNPYLKTFINLNAKNSNISADDVKRQVMASGQAKEFLQAFKKWEEKNVKERTPAPDPDPKKETSKNVDENVNGDDELNDSDFLKSCIRLNAENFKKFVYENFDEINRRPKWVQEKLNVNGKWGRVLPNEPWPGTEIKTEVYYDPVQNDDKNNDLDDATTKTDGGEGKGTGLDEIVQNSSNGGVDITQFPAFLQLQDIHKNYPDVYRQIMPGRELKTEQDLKAAIAECDDLIDFYRGGQGS